VTPTFTGATAGNGYRIGSTDFFDRTAGNLAYFVVYNRVLTSDEVADNYDASKRK
jgi:hypothetical protein